MPRTNRILVVDDNEPNLVLMAAILKRADYHDVELLQDSTRFLEVLDVFAPDIILLDMHMPVVDGFEILRLMGERFGSREMLPVLVITADATTQTREAVLAAGADDMLVKPVDRVEVVQRTNNLLEKRHLYRQLHSHNQVLQDELIEKTRDEAERLREVTEKRAVIQAVLDNEQFRIVYQPIVNVADQSIAGVEALSRFSSIPPRPPNEWFDDAATAGLRAELELATIRAALRNIDSLPEGAYISVNSSAETLDEPELVTILSDSDPSRIVIEITEHTHIADYASLGETLTSLRAMGVRIAVDDAGAGFAGLSHILQLRPDLIKLDVALIRDIGSDPAKRALATAMVSFGRDIGAQIVAEGVETLSEFHAIQRVGVCKVQGYLLGRPQDLPVTLERVDLPRGPMRNFGGQNSHQMPQVTRATEVTL